MNKLKYALNHGKIIIAVLLIAIFFLTSTVFDVVSQLNSAKNGLEMLLVDVRLSIGGANELAKSAKKKTSVKYVGASTITEDDTREYIKTVSDYSFADYLTDLTTSKDAEIVFAPEHLLPEIFLMKNIIPLGIDGITDEKCFYNGVLYAFPLEDTYVTEYKSEIITLQEKTYAVLLDGDHKEDARQYLQILNSEKK